MYWYPTELICADKTRKHSSKRGSLASYGVPEGRRSTLGPAYNEFAYNEHPDTKSK